MSASGPPYLKELRTYLEEHLDDATSVLAALAALLSDPGSYRSAKGEPGQAVLDYVHELVLTDRAMRAHLVDPATPVNRELFDGKWGAVWRNARAYSPAAGSYEYAVCISFAGTDRPIAERIADALRSEPTNRDVFYDEFEATELWGQELFDYLHEVYSRKSMFCLILFSHAYRQRAWTRHELRAAQTRTLKERESYVLPIALDEGAVPEPFATVGYWPFSPGDEPKIAEAAEQKINDWVAANYFTVEELAEVFTRQRVAVAVLAGFRKGVDAALATGDSTTAEPLRAVALICAVNSERLAPPVRALVEWVLFAEGSVGDMFGADESITVFDDARVKRSVGLHGPLLYNHEGWDAHIDAIKQHWDSVEAELQEGAQDP